MDGKFTVKDSGKREEFASGMVRDTTDDKVDYELPMNGPMFDRWAEHLTKGAKKYPDTAPGEPNWMLASGEAERARFRKSAVRHFRKWLRGETDEDHAAAVFFNINGVEYVKAKRDKEIHKQARAIPHAITEEQCGEVATNSTTCDDNRNQSIEKDFVSCGYERAKARPFNPWNAFTRR